MAYISQEKKKRIQEGLKNVIPKGWRWSLSVENHSTLTLTIRAAPLDLLRATRGYIYGRHMASVNPYHVRESFREDEPVVADLFEKIHKVMMDGNHDNSDPMTDYFDVGWYVQIYIGKWDKEFKVLDA